MARERTTWMRIAPHLVHPLTCLMPTRQKLSRSRLAMGAALAVNDLLSLDRNRSMDAEKHLPAGRIVSRQELSRLLPGYQENGSTGAAVWHDAQIYNSERLLLEFLLSATREGAVVANYVEATRFLQVDRQVQGVTARDVLTGQQFDIRANMVINCAGAWVEDLLRGVQVRSAYGTSIAMNLMVDKVWSRVAAGLPTRPVDGRMPQILFFVPWHNRTMIGTWHLPWSEAPEKFKITDAVLTKFIDEINSAHPALRFSLADIRHVTWGFLPVSRQDGQSETVRLTRDGVVLDHQHDDRLSGLISVLGVKYTTARAVAEQAVDLAVRKLVVKGKTCQTHTVPIHGGWIGDFKAFLNQALARAPRLLNEDSIEHLVYTHGSEYQHFVQEMLEQPALRERIDPRLPVTAAEVVHAVRQEMALTLADVIQRRTELGALGLPALPVLQKCAQLMACELDWSLDRQQQEIESVVQKYPIRKMERVPA
jgi:glycerol-3-phosphate dehydrogenase